MSRYIVATNNRTPITVEAPNWLGAMALGIAQLADAETIDRLVCETLPNGTVIARDARRGTAYIIRREARDDLLPDEATMEVDSDEDELFAMDADSEEIEDPNSLQASIAEIFELDEEDSEVLERINDIHSASGVIEAWDAALALAGELVPCEAGSALQLTLQETLRFVSVFGPDSTKLLGVELASDKGIVGFCTRQRLGLLIRDAAHDDRHYTEVDQHTGFSTHAILCAPVALESVTYGCIELLNAEGEESFNKDQLAVVALIADSLAERLSDH